MNQKEIDKKDGISEDRLNSEKTERKAKSKIFKKKVKLWVGLLICAFVVAAAAFLPFFMIFLGDTQAGKGEFQTAKTLYSCCFGVGESEKRLEAVNTILLAKDGEAKSGIETALQNDIRVQVTYDLNGGRFINSSRQETVILQKKNDFADFYKATKENYDFAGWSVTKAVYAPKFDDSLVELSLKANFEPSVYTISYTNLFSNTQSNPFEYTVETPTITLENPTRVGYTFVGWTGSDINGETGTVVIPQGSSGNRAYIANWMPNQYAVEFKPDVDCQIENPMTVTYDDEYIMPEIQKRGYTYRGWTDGTTTYTTGLWTLTNGISVTPVWDLNVYKLQYDLSGGNVNTANKSTYTVLDEAITLNNPTRSGYTFLGWTYGGQNDPVKKMIIPAHSIGDYKFKANWVGNPHVIVLDLAGGTASTNTVNVVFGDPYSLPVPTKTGYSFGGWYNGNKQYNQGIWDQNNDIQVAAKWTANQYKLTFDSAGGSYAAPMTVTYDTYVTLPTTTRTGYEFRGWYRWNTKYESGVWKTPNDVPFTATWRPKTYTVYLDANGGVSPQSSVTMTYDAAFQLPTPTRKGHTFLGWYSGNTRHWMSGTWKQDSGISLSARWEANKYTIQLFPDGGNMQNSQQTITYGTRYSLSSPTRTGYNFVGWYSGSEKIANSGTYEYDNNLILIAKWEGKEYTVTMNASGGMVSSSKKTVTYGEKYKLPTPIKDGYDFLGWYDYSTKIPTSDIWEIAKNVSLTAKWEASEYTVKLDAEGGSVSKKKMTVTYNERYTLPTPTKTGYTFAGWYKGSKKFDSSGYWSYTDDVTLTAVWDANEYEIYLDANGGNVSTRYISVEYEKKYTLPTPTRIGYTFEGWYSGSTKVTSGTYNTLGDVYLTAHWKYIEIQPEYSY